jgi:phasin family protein
MATAATKTTQRAKQMVEEATASTNEAVKEGFSRSMTAFAEMNSVSKQAFDAWVESATVASRGVEAINGQVMAYAKKSMESGVAAAKSLSGAKSLKEIVDIQTAYAKSSFDSYVSEMTKLSDFAQTVTKDAIKPLNERATAVASLFQPAR